MSQVIHHLEESLKEFLNDVQSDNYNLKTANFHKYNNLKIVMEPNRNKIPHFIIKIGISESTYNIENCERISGGLGTDERYIRRWFEKGFIKAELEQAWASQEKFKQVVMKKDLDDYDD